MSATETAVCTCVEFNPANTEVRQCPEHFHLWKGSKRLASVGSIVRASFPMDPTIPPAVLENARDRGTELDRLFASYCLGTLQCIPKGTREDARDLFYKVQNWYDQQNFKRVEVQVLLGCEDYGGVLDFRFDGIPVDLKGTYNVEQSARLQVAGYALLADLRFGPAQILHVTERFKEPKLVALKDEDFDDWLILVEHWRMRNRRTNGKAKE